jgi:hypothetical protein
MVRRDRRWRSGRRGLSAAAAIGVAVIAIAPAIGPQVRAEPTSELSRARDLYRAAEAAMQEGRFDDATRGYGAAYDLSKDPALLFKIGRAHERAGKCEIALAYYARYLREGKPEERFAAATRQRIAACTPVRDSPSGPATPPGPVAAPGPGAAPTPGSAAPPTPGPAAPPTPGSAAAPTPGSAAAPTPGSAAAPTPGSAAAPTPGSAAPPPPGPAAAPTPGSAAAPIPGPAAAPIPGPAAAPTTPSIRDAAARGEPPVAPPRSPAARLIPSHRAQAAWILAGTGIALATLGGVLAYAANSSENDIRDLYVGFAGQPASFDPATRQRYAELIDEGHRFEHLSWTAFGFAGATAIGAVVLFALSGEHDGNAPGARVSPVLSNRGAGVAVRF